MSPAWTRDSAACSSFPRVSGDEPRGLDEQTEALKFSPRERG